MRKHCLCTMAFWLIALIVQPITFAEGRGEHHQMISQPLADTSQPEKKIYFTLRLGQGGFKDGRSPIGKLGGGQLALDIQPRQLPIALSLFSEYYTNSPDPTHPYEIADMTVVNLLYMTQLFDIERATFFVGGGLGRLNVPKGEEESDQMVKGTVYNLEGGINVRAFWKIGFYGVGKYLYAQKTTYNMKVIDFNEGIVLLGITLNFAL